MQGLLTLSSAAATLGAAHKVTLKHVPFGPKSRNRMRSASVIFYQL